MKVLNLFGEFEEVTLKSMRTKIDIKKLDIKGTALPQDILTKVYTNPDKKYYAIGEVAQMFNVKSSLLRYWETRFSDLKPSKNERGVRRYSKKDIEILNKIHYYVKEKKWSIDGAKNYIEKVGISDTKKILLTKLENIKAQLIKLNGDLNI